MMITLTNVGSTYDAITASQGLGVGVIDFTGVTEIRLVVRVNKIGTGTQSWQIWATNLDGSNGIEVGVINDAGATGIKTLTQTFTPPELSGEKIVRIRCKSTVAADDPIYLGGSVVAK